MRDARVEGVRVALDAEGERLRLALEAHPDVVKVNASEASAACSACRPRGATTRWRRRRSSAISPAADGHAGVVTRGAEGVVLAAPDGTIYEGRLYVRGRYPVGSGDAFLAGLVTALDRGDDWEERLRLGLGAATANAEMPGAGKLEPGRAAALAEQADVTAGRIRSGPNRR